MNGGSKRVRSGWFHSPQENTMDWITDRLPTERDADGYGNVRIPKYPADLPDKSRDGSRVYQHYSLIIPGQPWWSRWAVQADPTPAEPPAPAPVAERKIVQVAVLPENETEDKIVNPCLFALCNDGTLFGLPLKNEMSTDAWHQLPPIPQPDPQP
jgi:hypothetical protein